VSEGHVLIIDDDSAFRFALGKALRRIGYEVREAASGEEALDKLRAPVPPDAALLDLRMQGIDGLDVLRRRRACPTRIIVLTGHGTVRAAVEAMQLGAFSFLEKPVDADVLSPLIDEAIAETRRNRGLGSGSSTPPIVGKSEAMEEVRRFVSRVGPTDETVAIYGETGTGKEVVAHHLHDASARNAGPFVALNAATVPKELFESELFGHKKGAFTGAVSDNLGLFRQAEGGTLFIDEVAELPLESQAKLLRALEAKQIRPVGDGREVPVDARILAASNRELWSEVQNGRFREDLYFRLQVFPIRIVPLRERPEDVVVLARHLLGRIRQKPPELTVEAERVLEGYEWPGNVRELLNVLRRACLFADSDHISGDLVRRMIAASVFSHTAAPPASSAPPKLAGSLADVEKSHIERILAEEGGNVTRAALALGIDRRTLQRKLRGYGIKADE